MFKILFYFTLGAVLSFSGISVLDKPLEFFTIVVIVLFIDSTISKIN
jgi:hypothetical protein